MNEGGRLPGSGFFKEVIAKLKHYSHARKSFDYDEDEEREEALLCSITYGYTRWL